MSKRHPAPIVYRNHGILHPLDVDLFHALRSGTFELAERCNVQIRQALPTPRRRVHLQFGRALLDDKIVELTLRGYSDGEWGPREPGYRYLDTICHEIAHFRAWGMYQDDTHSPHFFTELAYVMSRLPKTGLYSVVEKFKLKDA